MLNFIVQYWIEFLFGLIATGATVACKKFYNLYKNEKVHQKNKEQEEFYEGLQQLIKERAEESQRAESSLQEQINAIKGGILSLQKRTFIESCKKLLKEDHEITLGEYESISEEHTIYNNLGGNHEGDEWFALVKTKATNNLTD